MENKILNTKIHVLNSSTKGKPGVGKILDFADMLIFNPKVGDALKDDNGNVNDGKVVISATEFNTANPESNKSLQYFLDVSKARLLAETVINNSYISKAGDAEKIENGDKITLLDLWGGGKNNYTKYSCDFLSRHLKVEYVERDKNKTPLGIGPSVVISIEYFPGKKSENGAIIADGERLDSVVFMKSTMEMKEAMLAVREHLLACRVRALVSGAF
jgi:hypothetical protein